MCRVSEQRLPLPPRPPEMLDADPEPELCGFMEFICAVHSQAQLFSASSDGSWAPALSLSILCVLKVIKEPFLNLTSIT